MAAFSIAAVTPYEAQVPEESTNAAPQPRPYGVYSVIALSGLTALGAEVLWTRLLALTFGPTVYTFSIILAVFLIGLGIGSAAGSVLAKRGFTLAMSQALLIIAIGWAAWMIAARLPYWDRNLSVQANPWMIFASDFLRCAIAILPASILWGASFPLALAAASSASIEAGRTVGQIYSANTLGAIVGAVAFSLFAIPQLGSGHSESLLMALAALSALIVSWGRLAFALIPVAVILAWLVPATPWQLIAAHSDGASPSEITSPWKRLYVAEGINSSIAYTEGIGKQRFFHVAGKIEASSTPSDMKLQRMLGHIPATAPRESSLGSDRRMRRRCDGRNVRRSSRSQRHHALRDRTADSARQCPFLR